MFERIHQKLGTAGFIISIVALVAALGGGAYAASDALNAKQKKQVKAIAKSFAGKDGAPGAAGTNGTIGKDGAQGPQGPQGPAGDDGDDGANGKTVLSGTAAPAAGTGSDGDFYIRTTTQQIWGPKGGVTPGSWGGVGPTDLKGDPWTVGGTLPPGATETGTWAVSGDVQTITDGNDQPVTVGDTNGITASISFTVPLAVPLAAANVHFQTEANFADFDEGGPETEGCTGSFFTSAIAPSGHLCVYGGVQQGSATFDGITNFDFAGNGAGVNGAFIPFSNVGAGTKALGTWAVTAP